MDEANATRVSAPPDQVAERRAGGFPPKHLQISLRIETAQSANHICGLLVDVLSKRGHQVNTVIVHRSEAPLAKYDRPRGPRG